MDQLVHEIADKAGLMPSEQYLIRKAASDARRDARQKQHLIRMAAIATEREANHQQHLIRMAAIADEYYAEAVRAKHAQERTAAPVGTSLLSLNLSLHVCFLCLILC